MTSEKAAQSYIDHHPEAEQYRDKLADFFNHFEGPKVIECGIGWLPTILLAHEALKLITPDYKISQIKEKFGGLRYYAGGGFPWDTPQGYAFESILGNAEREASTICENCGEKGYGPNFFYVKIRTFSGWHHTYCDPCEVEYIQKRYGKKCETDEKVKQYFDSVKAEVERMKQFHIESAERAKKYEEENQAKIAEREAKKNAANSD